MTVGTESARARRWSFDALVPAHQRRTFEEVGERLDLDVGDTRAKRSGFWAMLVLSGLIAVAGVITDSTATVIGAMIVAPLSTPILGIGIGIVAADVAKVGRSAAYVLGGLATVVALGWIAAQALPSTTDLLANSQVTGRTSPGVGDLVAAFATGFAGALALARKDLADVLPGIAIAISLVPPLGVVGVCLGSGQASLALGALILFASNAVALVVAAIVVFTSIGYAREAQEARSSAGAPRRRAAYVAVAVALVVVAVPMVANTVQAALADLWLSQSGEAAEQWLSGVPGAQVQDVRWQGKDVAVDVLFEGDTPDVAPLREKIDAIVPWDPQVLVVHTVGETL
ncbi:TIGR00341 family protein [Cellulomonas sp. HZM]|uniref:TIGR00341 family protein n=1 Tax=Cellulomonas sp. HZM TaxID=1454010 RepID=UPI00069220D9|nr:TIGR00341 family protein [Cellulomonas sp. HZM]